MFVVEVYAAPTRAYPLLARCNWLAGHTGKIGMNSIKKKDGQKVLFHQKKTAPSTSETPVPELLRFLELSIGEKTDAYLLKLALRDARTESIAKTSENILIHLKRLEQITPASEAHEGKKQKSRTTKK